MTNRFTLILLTIFCSSCMSNKHIQKNKLINDKAITNAFSIILQDLIQEYGDLEHYYDDEETYAMYKDSGSIVIANSLQLLTLKSSLFKNYRSIIKDSTESYTRLAIQDTVALLHNIQSNQNLKYSSLKSWDFSNLLHDQNNLMLVEFSEPFESQGINYCFVQISINPINFGPPFGANFLYQFEICSMNESIVSKRYGPYGWSSHFGDFIPIKELNEISRN